MGFEDEMNEWYDERVDTDIKLSTGSIEFKRGNIISSNSVSIGTILWNYICWVSINGKYWCGFTVSGSKSFPEKVYSKGRNGKMGNT